MERAPQTLWLWSICWFWAFAAHGESTLCILRNQDSFWQRLGRSQAYHPLSSQEIRWFHTPAQDRKLKFWAGSFWKIEHNIQSSHKTMIRVRDQLRRSSRGYTRILTENPMGQGLNCFTEMTQLYFYKDNIVLKFWFSFIVFIYLFVYLFLIFYWGIA